MKVTQIKTDRNRNIEIKRGEILKNQYDVIARYWFDNLDNVIREWTRDEYITCDPRRTHEVENNEGLLVVAHCVEIRNYYANKDDKQVLNFLLRFDYSEEE